MTDRKRDTALTQDEIGKRIAADLPHWRLQDGWLVRTYRTQGWKGTLMVVNAVGHLAEAAFHHPDILASYASAEVRLQTHDAKGITEKDIALARKIEEVIAWQPGKDGGPLEGTPRDAQHAYIKYD